MINDTSFIKDSLEWIGGIAVGLIGIIWNLITGRIKKLEDRVDDLKEHTITKTTFDLHMQDEKEVQRDLREGLREVTELITQIEQRSTSRHADLLTLLINRKE